MSRFGAFRGAGALAVAVCLAAGCRHQPHDAAGAADSYADPTVALGDSQAADIQVALARTLEGRGGAGQAVQVYQEAVRKDPSRADAWVRLAVLSDREGKFVEAGDYYRRALDLQPENPDIHCNLGYSFYLQERWAEAEQSLRKALVLKPDHQRALNNLGLVLGRQGREADTLEAFRRSGCSPADAHLNLAYTLVLSGSWKQARKHYEAALALEPSSDVARKGLAGLNSFAAKMEDSSPQPVMTTGGLDDPHSAAHVDGHAPSSPDCR